MKDATDNPAASPQRSKKELIVAISLVVCLLIVGFWEVMSKRSERVWDAFQLSAADFQGFKFQSEGWRIDQRKISPSPTDPEILKFDMLRQVASRHGTITYRNGLPVVTTNSPNSATNRQLSAMPIRSRLIHGYNMVDCMRIKGYAVKLLHDDMTDFSGRVQIWASFLSLIGMILKKNYLQRQRLENEVSDVPIFFQRKRRQKNLRRKEEDEAPNNDQRPSRLAAGLNRENRPAS